MVSCPNSGFAASFQVEGYFFGMCFMFFFVFQPGFGVFMASVAFVALPCFIYLLVSIYLSIHPFVYLSIYLSTYLSVCLSVCLAVFLSICLSVLFIYLIYLFYLSILSIVSLLSIYLSIYLIQSNLPNLILSYLILSHFILFYPIYLICLTYPAYLI